MQPNLSHHERLASIALGSLAFVNGFSRRSSMPHHLQKAAGIAMIVRGLAGYCPLYRAFHRRPLHAPHAIERSIIIDRPVEDVRSMLDEGDPMLHESSRKIFPITAGYLLWNLDLEPIGDGLMTHVRARLSDQNESLEIKTYLSRQVIRSLADQELQRIKQLLEGKSHSTLHS
jgi:hypothetical protein